MDRATRQKIDQFLISQGITPPKSDFLAGQLYADHFHAEAAAKNPEVQRLIQTGGTGTVNKVIGDTDVRVENGKITHYSTGGIWKPIIAAGVVAGTAGLASAFAPAATTPTALTPAATAAGGGSAAVGGGTATGALAGGLTPSFAVPASLAGVEGGTTAALAGGTGVLGTLGKYGEIASDVSQSLQQGRRQDDYANLIAASQNNRALVDAAQFNLNVPLTRAQQTARGDLMSSPTMQDSAVTGSGRNINISGGVRPSSFGTDTTKAGEELKRQALVKLMDPASDQLTPQLTTPRRPGAAETGAGIVGTGLGILGAYNAYRGR